MTARTQLLHGLAALLLTAALGLPGVQAQTLQERMASRYHEVFDLAPIIN